ncbi:hypothetical protein ACSBR1_030413 [Camellia fascicularis]
MANDRQKEKIRDDVPCGSSKHANPNIEEGNHNEGAWDQNPGDKDINKDGDTPKKSSRDEYYNKSDL